MPSDDVDAIVALVAEHPGRTADDRAELVEEPEGDPEHVRELLETALERGLVIEADSTYWVMRTGTYAYAEYDHPEP